MNRIENLFNSFMQLFENNAQLVTLLTVISVATFIGTLILIPVLIVKMPPDYFIRCKTELIKNYFKHPVLRMLVHILKNLFGAVFIIAGFVMLFIPGQGLLTILIGSTLIDLPHKKDLEYRVICRPHIYKAINLLRHKFNKESIMLRPSKTAKPSRGLRYFRNFKIAKKLRFTKISRISKRVKLPQKSKKTKKP